MAFLHKGLENLRLGELDEGELTEDRTAAFSFAPPLMKMAEKNAPRADAAHLTSRKMASGYEILQQLNGL